MIKVNLLPVKRARRKEAGQKQLALMGVAVLAAVGVVTYIHLTTSAELDDLRRQNRIIQSDIDRFKAELGDYDKVLAQREGLMKQRKSIESLEAGRTGPVFLLRELSEILTPGKGPTFDRVVYEESLRRDPNVGFNATWETRRAWLDSMDEDQRNLKIRGSAKSVDDAGEFAKRLSSSVFFSNVKLESATQAGGTAQNAIKHVTFNVSAQVVY
jgi:type IV pilus assembly protein PilN